MTVFQSVLDQLVQSNAAVMINEGLEIIAQVVHNNRGGERRMRKLSERMLDFCMCLSTPETSSVSPSASLV